MCRFHSCSVQPDCVQIMMVEEAGTEVGAEVEVAAVAVTAIPSG